MKKVTALAMAAVVAASALTGCGSSSTAETTAAATEAKTEAAAAASTEAAKEDGKTYNVGICQLVQHEALDRATQGFEINSVTMLNLIFRTHPAIPQHAQRSSTSSFPTMLI